MKKEQILLSIGFLLFMIGGGGIQSDGIYMLLFAAIALAGLGLIIRGGRVEEQNELKDFYFTFGSWEGMPFQNGYIIVKAKDIKEAGRKFAKWFPNPEDEETLNCSDYYGAEEWQEILEKGYYKEQEPLAIMQ